MPINTIVYIRFTPKAQNKTSYKQKEKVGDEKCNIFS